MSIDDTYDLIIIGGGPGGLTAGIYAMRAALKTVLIELGVPGGQMNNSDSVENWPGDEHIGGSELGVKFHQHAQSYGLEIISQEVVDLEPGLDIHTVKLANGDQLRAHAVILATGGSPRKLNIPGEEEHYGKGVSYCAVCDGFFFREKTVVVVGGGDSAVEEATYLTKFAEKVYLQSRSAPAAPATWMRTWCTMPCISWSWTASISCSSRTSATWCARRVSISASTAM